MTTANEQSQHWRTPAATAWIDRDRKRRALIVKEAVVCAYDVDWFIPPYSTEQWFALAPDDPRRAASNLLAAERFQRILEDLHPGVVDELLFPIVRRMPKLDGGNGAIAFLHACDEHDRARSDGS